MLCEATLAVGVDVGGTAIKAGVVDGNGRLLARATASTAFEGGEVVGMQIPRLVEQVIRDAGIQEDAIAVVGVAVPGVVREGRVWAPNISGWTWFPLHRLLLAAMGQPVAIDSDRCAAVVGEHWLGAARGVDDVVFIIVGTGIGAGIMVGGRVVRGTGGVAGSIGWLAVHHPAQAEYMRTGCLEALAAGPSVVRRARDLGVVAETAEDVVAAARAGDRAARSVLEEAGESLGIGVAAIVSTLNPTLVVIGGGLASAGPLLMDPLVRALRVWAQPLAAESIRVVGSELGENAGITGAARLALDQLGCVKAAGGSERLPLPSS